MRTSLKIVSILSLAALCALPAAYAVGLVSAAESKTGMLVGTLGWFATAPFWIRPRKA